MTATTILCGNLDYGVYIYIRKRRFDVSTYIIYGYHYFKTVTRMCFRNAIIAFNNSNNKFVKLMFWS